jgi:hypothetical protein
MPRADLAIVGASVASLTWLMALDSMRSDLSERLSGLAVSDSWSDTVARLPFDIWAGGAESGPAASRSYERARLPGLRRLAQRKMSLEAAASDARSIEKLSPGELDEPRLAARG